MSRNSNYAVFQYANQVISEEIINKAKVSADRVYREVQKEIRIHVEETYREMLGVSTRGIAKGNMGIPFFQKRWADLDPWYLQSQKGITGKNQDYYKLSGDLMDTLLSQSPLEDFGEPEVRYSTGQGSKIRFDSRGRPQYAKGSGKRGFAPYSILNDLNFQIEVDAFPALKRKGYRSAMTKMVSGHNLMKMMIFEFGRNGGKDQPARPLVRPFLKWYATKGVFWKIQEILAGKPGR